MRILLNGITGVNCREIERGTGLASLTVRKFMCGKDTGEEVRDKVAEFVWKKLNSHLLICEEDKKND